MISKLFNLLLIPSLALSLTACAGFHIDETTDPYYTAEEDISDEFDPAEIEREIASAIKPKYTEQDLKLDDEFVTPKRSQRKPASVKRRSSKNTVPKKAGSTL